VDAILDEFDDYLALQCGRSPHTRRAYLGDLRSLFAFLAKRGSDLDGLSVPLLPVLACRPGRRWCRPHDAGASHLGGQGFHRVGGAARPAGQRPRRQAAGAEGASHTAGSDAPGPGAGGDGRREIRF
jgi:Phage integrase, N-terminal SAM-like domain